MIVYFYNIYEGILFFVFLNGLFNTILDIIITYTKVLWLYFNSVLILRHTWLEHIWRFGITVEEVHHIFLEHIYRDIAMLKLQFKKKDVLNKTGGIYLIILVEKQLCPCPKLQKNLPKVKKRVWKWWKWPSWKPKLVQTFNFKGY